MITKKTKYALNALVAMASAPVEGPQLIEDLAARARVPKKFLELILLDLKKGGLVQSRKGRGGGYFLARAAEEISVAEVMRLTGGAIAPVPCVSRLHYERCEECAEEAVCGIRPVMKEAYVASVSILESTSVAEVIAKSLAAQDARQDNAMYYI